MVKANTPAMTPMAIAKAKKRMRVLKERDLARQEKLKAQLDEWFEKVGTLHPRYMYDFPRVAVRTKSAHVPHIALLLLSLTLMETERFSVMSCGSSSSSSSPTIRSPTRRR